MRPSRRLLVFAAALLVAGCCLVTGVDGEGGLTVRATGSRLELANRGDATVYYQLFEANTAALSLWGACDHPSQPCPRVAAGRTAMVPYDSISGYKPGADSAIVYWWHLLPKAGGGYRVDEVRSRRVPL